MVDFIKGGLLGSSNNLGQIDTILPSAISASKTLAPFDDMVSLVDTTSGNVVLTLPPASVAGIVFYSNRVDSSDNELSICPDGSDTIGGTGCFLIGNINESVTLYSDGGTNWVVLSFNTFAIAAMRLNGGDTTQALTTGFLVFTAWDDNFFSTPGRLLADQANNQIDVEDLQGLVQDGYRISFSGSFEYANNVDVDFLVYVDGVATTLGGQLTGNGANPVPLSFEGIVRVTSAPISIDIRVKADSASTLDIFNGVSLLADRIGG